MRDNERSRLVVEGWRGGSAPSATERNERPAGVSHLLAADDALSPGRWGTHIALCGLELCRPSVTAVARDEDSEGSPEDVRYCPECVREAHRWVGDVSPAGEGGHLRWQDATTAELELTSGPVHPHDEDRTFVELTVSSLPRGADERDPLPRVRVRMTRRTTPERVTT